MVVVAAEQRGRAIGRIRLQRIGDASAENLPAFIDDSVTPGSLVITDGWLGYTGLERLGFQHEIRNILQGKYPRAVTHGSLRTLQRGHSKPSRHRTRVRYSRQFPKSPTIFPTF